MEEKRSGGGAMPHRIEVEETVRVSSGGNDGSEDIHELRKYIMQMMHSEMELMESVKQNEDSIDVVNARVEKLKDVIANERRRRKSAELLMLKSSSELKTLTDKQIVAEAKYRQHCESIAQRDVECADLKAKYQHLRRAIQSLEAHANASTVAIDTTASATQETKGRLKAVIEAMHGDNDKDELRRGELQKVRAKKRYIDQHAQQIAADAKSIHERHEELQAKLCIVERSLRETDATLERLDADGAHQRVRLLEEIRRLLNLKEQSSKKLVTKQKKYRVKMKGEIATLKKRVAFVTRELEGHEMGVEDTLSSLAPFQASRGLLESRVSELEAEIARVQESIRVVREQIDNFDASKEVFDLSSMKSELEAKNIEVERAVRDLTALKDELARIQEGDERAREELRRADDQLARASSVELDEELLKAQDVLKELEEQRSTLVAENELVKETFDRLATQAQKSRQQLKRAKSSTAKQQKELRKSTQRHEEAKARLMKEQERLAIVDEAELLAIRVESTLNEEKATNDTRLAKLKETLSEEECELKRRCLEEEARLKKELQEWSEKVNALQALLV